MRVGFGRFLRWKSLIYKGFRRIEFQNFISFLRVFLAFFRSKDYTWDIRRVVREVEGATLEIMWLVLKSEYLCMEAYRSGCNELHSKCSCPQGHVGSNPTASAIKALKTLCFRGFFFCSGSIYFGENNSNGALGAPLCGARLIPHHTHYTRKMYTVVPQWCPELLKSYEK